MAAQQVRIAARERLAQKIKAQALGSADDANIRQSKSILVSTGTTTAPKNPYVVRNPYASRPSSSTSTGSTSKTPSISAAAPSANLPASGICSASISAGSSSASTFSSTRYVSRRARGMAQRNKRKKQQQGTAEANNTLEAMDALNQCLHQVRTDVFTGCSLGFVRFINCGNINVDSNLSFKDGLLFPTTSPGSISSTDQSQPPGTGHTSSIGKEPSYNSNASRR